MFSFLKNNNLKSINVNDLDDILGQINLIDVREPYEFKGGSLKGAKSIPMDTLLNNPEKYLSKEKTYHIMCLSGARSRATCKVLSQQGFDVVNVSGGIGSYVGTKRSRQTA